MNKIPMTINGVKALHEELHRLKTLDRQKVIDAIAEARAHGDLKENAEYHAARERQGFIEGRIQEVENKLAMAQIIDVTKLKNDEKVIFGSTVSLVNLENNNMITYQIVGEDEANLKLGKISVTSPLARAMIGKYKSDVINVQAPGGNQTYKVHQVEYKG